MRHDSTSPASDFELPLSPTEFSVLLVLAEQPLYGYAIVRAIGERWAGEVSLASGNLYPVLDRLLRKEWIRETDPPATGDVDRRRKYYALTDTGRAAMTAEARRLSGMVATVARLGILGAAGGAS